MITRLFDPTATTERRGTARILDTPRAGGLEPWGLDSEAPQPRAEDRALRCVSYPTRPRDVPSRQRYAEEECWLRGGCDVESEHGHVRSTRRGTQPTRMNP